ncbi:MAG TPA: GcrA family cell cycle regulator [Dongiaceae bacterium]|jgi:GcrA cell cycle regulator|nr:GcrA family cell cycle regulator [Dongiaceae bacterium]
MEWNEKRVETLRQLWGQGQTASQIAAILGGITRNAVIGKAHRLGLTARPSPIKREMAARLPKRPASIIAPKKATAPAALRGAVVQPRLDPRKDPHFSRPSMTSRIGGGNMRGCSWPIGDPKSADFHFCGDANVPGRPYCLEHCAVAYQRKSDAA